MALGVFPKTESRHQLPPRIYPLGVTRVATCERLTVFAVEFALRDADRDYLPEKLVHDVYPVILGGEVFKPFSDIVLDPVGLPIKAAKKIRATIKKFEEYVNLKTGLENVGIRRENERLKLIFGSEPLIELTSYGLSRSGQTFCKSATLKTT